jgi:glycosyltransferase involved in cell wall biosynthesis
LENFKLGILIPLKARKVSQNWAIIEMALSRVLCSINNQTSDSFECVVVGHDEPLCCSENNISKNTTFINFDEFEPPSQKEFSGMELQLKYEFDRCSKIAKGMMYLENKDITHWFALDADDLLHATFVQVLSEINDPDAIVIDNGYFYFENREIVNEGNDFSLVCGSSCIIKAHVSSIPKLLDNKAYREIFYGKVPHMNVKDYFVSNNLSFIVPEERLVMYVRDHGDNISNYYFTDWLPRVKKWIKLHMKALQFTKKEYQSFGFDHDDSKKE